MFKIKMETPSEWHEHQEDREVWVRPVEKQGEKKVGKCMGLNFQGAEVK